ncbi:hypothetical protein [Brevibacillus parabrevis]|nr:hypothetical protein [Brevibacillus parabrevis]MED1722735.1 hypothetical protein [Brevibacillus parabrevis]
MEWKDILRHHLFARASAVFPQIEVVQRNIKTFSTIAEKVFGLWI